MQIIVWRCFLGILAVLTLAVMLAACGKKEQPVAATPPAPEVAQPTPEQTPAVPPVTSEVLTPPPSDNSQALQAAEAARKARDYEKAAAALVVIQRRQLSEQQAAAANAQMLQLQRDLVNALASGDPKAKAAAEMLRQAPLH